MNIAGQALQHAHNKWKMGLLISLNHPEYDQLMSNPETPSGDRDTVYSIISLFSDGNEEAEQEITNKLREKYSSYF